MRVLILGGAGMVGQKLAARLLGRGYLDFGGERRELTRLVLFDRVAPPSNGDERLETVSGDITDPATLKRFLEPAPDLIFHLAAVVSGEAETDFDLGMAVNLQATMSLLEACRRLDTAPRLVFSSSVAVFGGELPPVIEDGTAPTPQSSYGAQKAACELLIGDYSRRGFVDGRVLRLPTLVVRPGQPNRATSSFASSIIREPLQGRDAVCPVAPETEMWLLSPRRGVDSLLRGAELPPDALGTNRTLNLPGLTVSVGEMVSGLREVAGEAAARRILWQPDAFIEGIVGSWPARFAPTRAARLGFGADDSMAAIIRAFIEDDLEPGGSPAE